MMATAVSPSSQLPARPQRVLACVLCQQRKKKCDRQYPCSNCIKSRTQCIPATQVTRKRRRRFPERDLMERLRKYEELLSQNNIKFEPLNKTSPGDNESPNAEGAEDSDEEHLKDAGVDWSSPSTGIGSDTVYKTKNVLHAIAKEFRYQDDSDSSLDDIRGVVVKNAWSELYKNDDHLFFGSHRSTVDISTLHPDPVQIFRLWQIYLDNVNPLLKVTHAPSVQGHIIEAASDISSIDPNLEALIFGIYSMAILSLTPDDCEAIFAVSQADLLTRYQFGCQQALINCGFLRTDDRNCLTALLLYLISVRPKSVPQSLCSLLGVAVRIAERMGIDDESILAKCTPLEAEMRRRLWWALALFDSRISEMAKFKSTTLGPFFDCKIPLNVNDSDLQIQMLEAPRVQGVCSESIFAVVRSEIGDFIRHSVFKGTITSPTSVGKDQSLLDSGNTLTALEKMIEEKYIKFCDPQNPLHYMTIWMARGYIAKCQLMEYHMRSRSSTLLLDTERDAAMLFAINMLDTNTNIMTSSLTKRFHWQAVSYFPFIAYIYLVQSLKRRPSSGHAERAWEAMSANYGACFLASYGHDNPFFKLFANIVFQAWNVRERYLKELGKELVIPGIISLILQEMSKGTEQQQDLFGQGGTGGNSEMNFDLLAIDGPSDAGSHPMPYIGTSQAGNGNKGPYPEMPAMVLPDFDINGWDWSAMDWNMINAPPSDMGAGFSFF